jgi:hypothetical protein
MAQDGAGLAEAFGARGFDVLHVERIEQIPAHDAHVVG